MDRNEYLEIVSAQVRCKRAVPYLKGELEDHIEDQKEAFVAAGMNPFEAEMAAVREMGDPVETGVELDRVHKPKMEWKVLFGAILMGLVGIGIQASIMLVVDQQYLQQEILSQSIILAVGVGIMLAICYLDYSILLKYAKNLWIVVNVLLFLMCFLDLPILTRVVNGVNRNVALVAYITIPLYAAVVYSYRKQGRKGLVKSVLNLILFMTILSFEVSLGFTAMLGLVDGIVLARAVHINWFGINKEERQKVIKCGILLLVIVGAGIVFTILYEGYTAFITVPDYYIARIDALLNGNVEDYIAEEITAFLHNAGNLHIEDISFLESYMRNDYTWLFVFKHFGNAIGWLAASVYGLFAFVLLRKAYCQKNQLGHFVALACTLFLIVESIFYIGGNFGITPFMGSFMPFLGDGITVGIITYSYMGILLSIFRNSNVVRN